MKGLLQSCLLACCPLVASAQSDQFLDGSLEWIQSDDMEILSAWAAYETRISANSTLSGRLDTARHQIDYRPNEEIDPFGEPVDLSENLYSAQLDFERLQGRHQITLSGTAYEGFRNPASIWIDRYYRQQYGLGGLPGVSYEEPDPRGYGLTAAYRLEVIPAAGFLSVSLGYLQDVVAPGYEIEDLETSFELIRSEEHLTTWTGSVSWEGVINDRSRTSQSLRVTNTTDRDPRFGWSGDLNVLLSDNLISRTSASFSIEDPDFEAGSISQTLEWSFRQQWSLALTLRYYEDTGQIESANLISSAAPALETTQAYLTLRYLSTDQTKGFAFSIGPYSTDYADTGIGTDRFVNLYQDRDWVWARFSGRLSF